VLTSEAANVHSGWLDEFADDYPPLIRDIILEGRSRLALEYLQAKDRMLSTRFAILKSLCESRREFWITPAILGTAPDRSTTGDPSFNAPWSYTGLPTVSFPIGLAPDGMPVAIQLIGCSLRDRKLLGAAEWCEQVIRTWQQ
jgi:Asp-tRNA(Asn)/Glu-tRNA(Gln) amidotransferase A subunit family amidase